MKRWHSLCQIAFSVLDMDDTLSFYRDLGFAPNGGTSLFGGHTSSKLQGYDGVKHDVRWMSDSTVGFQLEFFHYTKPLPRPPRVDARANDIGYQRLSIWVADLDAVLSRLQARGVLPLTQPRDYGDGRRVCVRDPNGVFVELMEGPITHPSMPHLDRYPLPVRTRALSLSIPDLEQALNYFEGILGMERAENHLHSPDMEALWAMDGAQVQSALLWAGDFAVELNEYKTPSGRPRRTDRHVGEAGIYHFALHFNTREDVERSYRYALQAGHASNTEPIWFGLATVAYMRTNQSFVVEYLQFSPWIKRFIGFGEPSYRE